MPVFRDNVAAVRHHGVMRMFLDRDPLLNPADFFHEDSPWPAKWIGHPDHRGEESVVIAYRRRVKLDRPLKCRIHLSADQRYELFLDGQRLGRGPERGDHRNWFYESYQLDLTAGDHTIVVRTWWLTDDAPTPYAQITSQPAFFLLAESGESIAPLQSNTMNPNAPDSPLPAMIDARGGEANKLLSSGIAEWECKRLAGYSFEKPQSQNAFLVSGAKVRIDGHEFPFGFEAGGGDGWQPAAIVSGAAVESIVAESRPRWLLRPALLPAMIEEKISVGRARHVEQVESFDNYTRIIESKNNLTGEMDQWNKLLAGKSPLTIPPNTMRRAIVDLDDYFCGFPELVARGGAGSTIRVLWAESLFTKPNSWEKGNRDQIEGKVFNGFGDTFTLGPGENPQRFETLWWEAGRYIEIVVQTKDQPLTIDSFAARQTHYPYQFDSKFEASDKRLAEVIPIALRTLEMCSHETYMDCPYYEQLMYVGDTRLQVLATYAMTHDDRLPRKALEVFDFSRSAGHDGLTMSRYPTKILQTIPPFSLWWIAMLHDFLMWRGDREFIAKRMNGVRTVIDAFLAYVSEDGLLRSPVGWNFVDWVPAWFHGMPPGAHDDVNGTLNWHLVYTLQLAAELETFVDEPELAARNRRLAARVRDAATKTFWDDSRGLLAEDAAQKNFSEHTQCIAMLSGMLDPSRQDRLAKGLLNDPNLARTTIYFTHYLFEAYRLLGRTDRLLDRMDLWFNLRSNGNRTTIEMPEPTRSDCHAWGAHPLYHYFATILGIRPQVAGFGRVTITPQLGPLTSAKGTMVHPKGLIRIDLQSKDGKLTGEIELPEGITGTLAANGATRELHCGKQQV